MNVKISSSSVRSFSAPPLLLGHRGARANKSIRENTIASFDRALADGCDGFEFDLRITADGEALVCHDAKTGEVSIARAKGGDLPHLPRLEKVIERYARSAFLDIELKVAGLEKLVAEVLRRHKITRGFVISSFLPKVLRAMHSADPNLPLGLVCETRSQLRRWRELPVDYVIVQHRLAGRKNILHMKDAGKKVLVWTVNGRAAMKKFAELGVDGIISDDTQMLTGTFTQEAQSGGFQRERS